MKKTLSIPALSCVFVFSLALALCAGPLDRTNVQPRTNPTTQSMIRVPGVVGVDWQTAMSSIQQAGLSVSVKPSKKKPEGFEGKVVSQVPGAGGIAMYGTSVTIYVYQVQNTPAGDSMSGTNWGTQSSGSTPASAYPSPGADGTAPPQQYYPPATGGVPAQGSQQFQMQQYYYPPQDAGGTPGQDQSGWGNTGTQDPNAQSGQQFTPDGYPAPQGEQGSVPVESQPVPAQ